MNKATQAYLQTKVRTTDQGQLLLLLYDGALKFLQQAREKILLKDYAAKGILISKVIDIINELSSTLNLEQGGTLADNLNNLYFLCTTRLLQANLKMNVEQLDSVVDILSGLRSAYAEIITTPEAQKASAQIATKLNTQGSITQRAAHIPKPVNNALPGHIGQVKARTAYGQVQGNTPPIMPATQQEIAQKPVPQQTAQKQTLQQAAQQLIAARPAQQQAAPRPAQQQARQQQTAQQQAGRPAQQKVAGQQATLRSVQQTLRPVQQTVQQAAQTATAGSSPKATVTFPERNPTSPKAVVTFPETTPPQAQVSNATPFSKEAVPARAAGLVAHVRMPNQAPTPKPQPAPVSTAQAKPQTPIQVPTSNAASANTPQNASQDTAQTATQEAQKTQPTSTQNPPQKGFGLANFKHLNIYGK